MARFFLALRVRREGVPVPLPDVPEAVEFPPDGVVRQVPAQIGPEQRDGPIRPRVPEVGGPLPQGRQQGGPEGVGPAPGMAAAVPGPEGGRVRVGRERGRPVVHGLPGDPEQVGDLGGRPAPVQFQDREEPPIRAGVGRPAEAIPDLPPLPGGQSDQAHMTSLRPTPSRSGPDVKKQVRTHLAAGDIREGTFRFDVEKIESWEPDLARG
jgi:hypothetical protein